MTLEERAGRQPATGMVLGRDTVFVVTGAAGSIVSAITADLAGASGGIFHLLDLDPGARSRRSRHRPLRHRQGGPQGRPHRAAARGR